MVAKIKRRRLHGVPVDGMLFDDNIACHHEQITEYIVYPRSFYRIVNRNIPYLQ